MIEIGWVPDPEGWELWPQAQAFLRPAQQRGNFEAVLEPDELLWACAEGSELLAAITAWKSNEGYVEVKLVGGKDRHKWLSAMNDKLGAAAAEAGATRLTAIGRRGWLKELSRLGWVKSGEVEDSYLYVRDLEAGIGQEIE